MKPTAIAQVLQRAGLVISRVWLVTSAAALAMLLLAALGVWHLRQEAIASQSRELALLSLALTDEVNRGLQGVEEGLHAVRSELAEGQLPRSGRSATHALKTLADLMPLVRTLWLADAQGQLTASSDATPMPSVSWFAPLLKPAQSSSLSISRPYVDPRSQESLVVVGLRDNATDRPEGGWIFAALPADRLLGAFSVATPAADARMAVFRSDGVLLAGHLVAPVVADETLVAQRLAREPGIALRHLRDGSTRLVSLHSLDRYDLRIMLTRDLQVMLLDWQRAAALTAVTLALLLVLLFLSVWLVQRARRQHLQAQRDLQQQLTRASRLQSLGTLAGGVAHDFNNILAAIVGFGEMAQDAAPAGSAQARHLGKVLQAALRGKALVQQVLAFGRGGARSSLVFEPEPVVLEALGMLAVSLRPGVVIEQALQAQGARVRGDPTQLHEAVMNLCSNALQAMPAGGMLSVVLERVPVTLARVLSHSQLPAGDYLRLTVADQGPGIASDVMEHLFEPFFTTRSAESGTGLGLAVVHGVVAEMGGAIDVQSLPGQGARFSLYFPECSQALAVAMPVSPGASQGHGQTLMVIDDDPALLAMIVEMLPGLGYQAQGFADPALALQALQDTPQQFAAVITDEVMPGMTGTQLAASLRRSAAKLPVFLLSGYGGDALAQRAAQAGVTRVLAKPVQKATLAQALADYLH